MQTSADNEEFEVPEKYFGDMKKHRDTFSSGTNIKYQLWGRLFSSGRSYRQMKTTEASEFGRRVAEDLFAQEISDFYEQVDQSIQHVKDIGRNLPELYEKNIKADEEELIPAIEAFETVMLDYFREVEKKGVFQDFIKFLMDTIGEDDDESIRQQSNLRRWNFYDGKLKIDSMDDYLKKTKRDIYVMMKHNTAELALITSADKAVRNINDMFLIPGKQWPSEYRKTREEWSITSEYLSALKEFIVLVERASHLTGLKVNSRVRYMFAQIEEGKRVSCEDEEDGQHEHLLTHTASTEVMYEILQRGDLSSTAEQSRKHGKSRRTHNFNEASWSDKIDCETHDVTFESDRIYSNFGSDSVAGKIVPGFEAHIALVFDENQLLSMGMKYAVLDGVHLFDPNFRGAGTNSSGLSIDLKTTPHMIIVTSAEKDKLLAFLKERSAYKDDLHDLSPEAFDFWVKNNVIVVDNLENFKATAEMRSRFFEAKKLKPQKGYTELTDFKAQFKVGDSENIFQFVPFRETGKTE